jgi:hypothetical protein
MSSVPPEPLGPPVTRRAGVRGLRPDVLLGAGIPLAMEALHGFVEPCRAGRGQPEALHNAVRHREDRSHEDKKVQGPFVIPRCEQDLDVGGTEPRRVQRQLPSIEDGGTEGLGPFGRLHILEELRQQPRRDPKGGGQGRVFTLTVVAAIEGVSKEKRKISAHCLQAIDFLIKRRKAVSRLFIILSREILGISIEKSTASLYSCHFS